MVIVCFRKATRNVVDTWLVCHASANTQGSVCCATDVGSPMQQQPCPASRTGSGATTPVRKISAHEFERGGLLKPIVNTIDGTPTFLSVGSNQELAAGNNSNPPGTPGERRTQRRSRHDLKHLDEKELIFELVKNWARCTFCNVNTNRMFSNMVSFL